MAMFQRSQGRSALPVMEPLEARQLFTAALVLVTNPIGAVVPYLPLTAPAASSALHVSATNPNLSVTANPAKPAAARLTATYGARGLSVLNYNGVTLLDTRARPAEGFRVAGYSLLKSDGSVVSVSDVNSGYTPTWDAARKKLTWQYAWGTVACQYVQQGDRLTMTLSVSNTSSTDTVLGVNILAMSARFPIMPAGFDATTPQMSFGAEPGAIAADFGSGVMLIANEQVNRKLYVGYATTTNTGTQNLFNVRIGSMPLSDDPNSWPSFNRPIAPGASDTYNVSLRFAKGGTSAQTIAADVYQNYAAQHGMKFQWTDRRAIATLNPTGSSSSGRSATNPRGWFNDPTVDVTTSQGLASFRQRLLAYADQSVSILKNMNAQGAITWDLEGENTAAAYVGDPRAAGTLAPELEYQGAVDAYFQKFRDAGLRVGVTIRPQQLVIDSNGAQQAAHQLTASDPGQQLIDKISYAKQRWGCTLFYIDSNSDSDADSIARAQAAHPDVLLIPENQNTEMYQFGAAYDELRLGVASTPQTVRGAVTGAFSVLYLDGGDITGRRAELIAAVKRGDILMFQGWWNNPNNALIKQIYQDANGVGRKKYESSATPGRAPLPPLFLAATLIGQPAYNAPRG